MPSLPPWLVVVMLLSTCVGCQGSAGLPAAGNPLQTLVRGALTRLDFDPILSVTVNGSGDGLLVMSGYFQADAVRNGQRYRLSGSYSATLGLQIQSAWYAGPD